MTALGLHDVVASLRARRAIAAMNAALAEAEEPAQLFDTAGESEPLDPWPPAADLQVSTFWPNVARVKPEGAYDEDEDAGELEDAPVEAAVEAPVEVATELAEMAPDEPMQEDSVEAPSADEGMLLRWFRESNALARGAIATMLSGTSDDLEWIDMRTTGAHSIKLTQERMQQIGMVMSDGTTPIAENPATFYWIMDKPRKYRGSYGAWDPIAAQWRIHTKRTVVPIEQRIAPTERGYAVDESGEWVRDAAAFTVNDYGDARKYNGTALGSALPHVLKQLAAHGDGACAAAAAGWGGTSPDEKVQYFTPCLRHVRVDAAVEHTTGKKYVYQPCAKPVAGRATWDATNSCFAYDLEAGELVPDCCDEPCCDERTADARAAA